VAGELYAEPNGPAPGRGHFAHPLPRRQEALAALACEIAASDQEGEAADHSVDVKQGQVAEALAAFGEAYDPGGQVGALHGDS
jgi:hypothetical protein